MAKTPPALPFSGVKLRQHRERRGWHQSDLAKACVNAGRQMDRSQISRFETGASNPPPPTLTALADALGVELDELLDPQLDSR
ncbi:helix-turn-helix domain-containing protein [Actinocrispum wychmicini]|uniref:Helix-turn-helix protein n=1 Tax=Actinocrispum wychmicini TaxID=1213861 RepID=A0A4R2JSP5_9PSEU|nr:helix-turn-helix transcriptional regulator [Actinocrispum wychmicini]TCO57195.1 helix-turn-helix protein [Actinocrispum wychmicini]